MGMTKFKRIAAGQYRDDESGWMITRYGPAVARFGHVDWRVTDAQGTVMRVRQSKAEAELAAHAALA